jgi:hypothetical protein
MRPKVLDNRVGMSLGFIFRICFCLWVQCEARLAVDSMAFNGILGVMMLHQCSTMLQAKQYTIYNALGMK